VSPEFRFLVADSTMAKQVPGGHPYDEQAGLEYQKNLAIMRESSTALQRFGHRCIDQEIKVSDSVEFHTGKRPLFPSSTAG
jgi:hypothetical protein